MRPIKFRGLSLATGEMIFGGGIDTQRDTPIIINQGVRFFVDKNTIGQFTGLTDKNGVDIYEGDLLRIPADCAYEETTYNCFEVFYHDNECIGGQNIGFCMNRMHSQGSSGGGRGYKFTPESISLNGFVVIGNIYQSPELLESV